MSIAQAVRKRIDAAPDGRVFGYRDFPEYARSPGAVIKAVGRLAADGRLKRLSKGRFYLPEQGWSGPLRWPSYDEVLRSFLYKNGRLRGYVTGFALYNRLGLTTQVPVTLVLAINGGRGRKRFGPARFILVKARAPVRERDVKLLQYLDVFRKINRIEASDINVSLLIMSDRIAELSGRERARLVKLAIDHYNPRARAVAGMVFSILNLPEAKTLSRSLNPATFYKVGLDKEKWPLARDWNIR